MNQFTEANRARWDELAALHSGSSFYRTEEFKAGRSKLRSVDLDEVGAVRGKRLLHLQCHFGLDTLSWAREGAIVTGFDFSAAAIEEARKLAAETGIAARFVRSTYDRLVDDLAGEQFDIVYLSYGVLCWLPDLAPVMRVVAALLKPGGAFHLIDGHPLVFALDDDQPSPETRSLKLLVSYFHEDEPHHGDAPGSYADLDAKLEHTATYEWNHPISEIVNAVIDAGLRLAFLHEFPYTFYPALPSMAEGADGWSRLPAPLDGMLPLMYSLKAVR